MDQVRFYGCLADVQSAGDRAVGGTTGDVAQHFDLAVAEGFVRRRAHKGYDARRHAGCEHRLPASCGPNSTKQLLARSVLEKVAGRAGLYSR